MTTDSLQRLCDVHYFSKECMVANKEHPSSILRRTEGNQRVFAAFIFNSKTRWERQRKRWQTNGLISGPMTKRTFRVKMFNVHWRNLKTENRALYFTVRPTVHPIPSEKIENALQTREIWTWACFSLSRGRKTLLKKNFLRRTTWFLWPSFSEIKTQYNQWLLRF